MHDYKSYKKRLIDFIVNIIGKTITRTTCVKYLRVFIDEKLT